MTEHQVTISIADHGFAAENGEAWLEAMLEWAPGAGPVVDQSLEAGTLSVTFTVEAADPHAAIATAEEVFGRAAQETELAAPRIVGLHAATYSSPLQRA